MYFTYIFTSAQLAPPLLQNLMNKLYNYINNIFLLIYEAHKYSALLYNLFTEFCKSGGASWAELIFSNITYTVDVSTSYTPCRVTHAFRCLRDRVYIKAINARLTTACFQRSRDCAISDGVSAIQ